MSELKTKDSKVEQFQPEATNALEDFLDSVSNAAKSDVTSKNDLGILITHEIEGEKISLKKAAISHTKTYDMSELLKQLQAQMEEHTLLEAYGTVPAPTANDPNATAPAPRDGSVKVVNQKWIYVPVINVDDEDSEPILKLQTEITIQSNDEDQIENAYERLTDSEEGSVIVRHRTADTPLVPNLQFVDTEVSFVSSSGSMPVATRKIMDSVDAKLESLLKSGLSTDLKKKVNSHIKDLKTAGKNVKRKGSIILEYLKHEYGNDEKDMMVLVNAYMEFLGMMKKNDETLHDFAQALKYKLEALHDSTWSMTDLYLVKVMSHALVHSDTTKLGQRIDYSKIYDAILMSIKEAKPLKPYKVITMLNSKAKTAKAAHNLVGNGTSINALHVIRTPRKNTRRWEKSFDKSPPSNLGFGRVGTDTLWCSKCAKLKKHQNEGWNGWNQLEITGTKKHRHWVEGKLQCPFAMKTRDKRKGNNENKSQNKSYKALSQELASIKKALAEKGLNL